MSRIKVRHPGGNEYSFFSSEEFSQAVHRGRISAEWEIFHARRSRWLPVAVHPVFQAGRLPRDERPLAFSDRISGLAGLSPAQG